jgi:hypothetical protein
MTDVTIRDDLRVGDEERDAVIRTLHDAFARGRITREELDERLDGALAARIAGDLRRVIADLPGSPGLHTAGFGGYGMPWEPGLRPSGPWGGTAPWNRNMTDIRHRRRACGGRPSLALPILGAFLIAALVTGATWPFFAAIKILLVAGLIMLVLGPARHRLGGHGRRSGRTGIGS